MRTRVCNSTTNIKRRQFPVSYHNKRIFYYIYILLYWGCRNKGLPKPFLTESYYLSSLGFELIYFNKLDLFPVGPGSRNFVAFDLSFRVLYKRFTKLS